MTRVGEEEGQDSNVVLGEGGDQGDRVGGIGEGVKEEGGAVDIVRLVAASRGGGEGDGDNCLLPVSANSL